MYQNPVPKTRQRFNEDYHQEKKFNRSQFIEDYQAESEVRSRTRKDVEEFRNEPEMRPRSKKTNEEYHRESEKRSVGRDSTDAYPRESLQRGKTRNSYDTEVEMRVKPKPSPGDQKNRRYFGEEERSRMKLSNETERHVYPRDKEGENFEESSKNRRSAQFRQRSPSPEIVKVSPQDRFRDAKEKFLSMERERLANQRRGQREESSSLNNKVC